MSDWRPFEPSREAVEAAWSRMECCIVDIPERRCVVHDNDELSCSHRCERSSDWRHADECDDPPPPACPIPFDDNCIGCGLRIREGELARLYEEGYVHADGCPERPAS